MAQVRQAAVVWQGDLMSGRGAVSADTSGSFRDLPVSWRTRAETTEAGQTSPEELLAAAHASCFAMALAGRLARAEMPPERLEVSAAVTFDRVGEAWRVTRSHLTVTGWVPNGDAARFREVAEAAKEQCPISQALKGNVELSVEATLAAPAPRMP